VSFDYDPPSAPELQPVAVAFMRYAFTHDLKVIIMGLWPQGPQQAEQAVQSAIDEDPALQDKIKYGVDYVNLGFQSGNEFVILRMGEGFKTQFPFEKRPQFFQYRLGPESFSRQTRHRGMGADRG
jgi:hypothetical protein